MFKVKIRRKGRNPGGRVVPPPESHVEVLHGDGSDAEALDLAGLTDMDTFITATGENETNIMSCMLAKHYDEQQ
jgi:Trk K+ transport system NAD-binding subunit